MTVLSYSVQFLDTVLDICKFPSQGGIYENIEYGLKIVVPCNAVGEGEMLEMKILPQFRGPFLVSDKYSLITPYYWIIPSLSLQKPIQIFMGHCLEMPIYQKSREVVILRADLDFASGSDLHCFDPILNPDISDTYPVLSFQIQNPCILCGALENNNTFFEIPGSVTTRKQCRVLYTLLFYEPEDNDVKQKPFNILIYACQSCSPAIKVSCFVYCWFSYFKNASLQECKRQAKERLKYELKVTTITELRFDTDKDEFEFIPNNKHILPKNLHVVGQSEWCNNEYFYMFTALTLQISKHYMSCPNFS